MRPWERRAGRAGRGEAPTDDESEEESRASTFDCGSGADLEEGARRELDEAGRGARFKPLFVCSMLMRHAPENVAAGGSAWQTMSCEDPDDFQALKGTRWPAEDFAYGDVVCLWGPGAACPPVGAEAFVRYGKMYGAEADGGWVRGGGIRGRG